VGYPERNGDVHRYDDIGELVADLEGLERSRSGLVAFRERAAAERLARDRGGELLEWSTLRARRHQVTILRGESSS
jgi:hypothetical protein